MSNEVIAKDKQDWWRLVRQDLTQWNQKNHEDDNLSIGDWIAEVGPKIHGGIAYRDRYGDWMYLFLTMMKMKKTLGNC